MFGNGWFNNNDETLDRVQETCEQIVDDIKTGWDMTVFGIEIALGQHPELDDDDESDQNYNDQN